MGRREATLITGASGYLGGLLAAVLVAESDGTVLAPIRAHHDPARVTARILDEARAWRGGDVDPDRLVVLLAAAGAPLDALVPRLRAFEVKDIVHAAGCLSYFNKSRLIEGNERLTTRLIELSHELGRPRFVYVSTAFASGYLHGPIYERLHDEPPADPNEYTRSKRRTEHIVAAGGLPYLILRPSAVIGHSGTGAYPGKPYGAYQIWTGLSKFLCDRYRPLIHAVAPRIPINLVHQDAVQAGFIAALRHVEADSVVHLATPDATAPTAEDMVQLWMERCGRPQEVRYYSKLSALDRSALDPGQRCVIEFAESNFEIMTHHFRFQTDRVEALRARGLDYAETDRDSLGRCLDEFLARDTRARAFMADVPHVRPTAIQVAMPWDEPRAIEHATT
jgi:nucleoside-diphosphate-sugar epimerase